MIRALALTICLAIHPLSGGPSGDIDVHPGKSGVDAAATEASKPHPPPPPTHSGVKNAGASPTYVTHYYPCSGDECAPGFSCPSGQRSALQSVTFADGSSAGTPFPVCLGSKAVVTAASVARAFRHVPIPTPALHIQPVKGRTLVNLRTNFYATGGRSFVRTVTLLGHRVTLRIHVDHYLFRFGDGATLSSTQAGAGYPRLTNTHTYLRKSVVHPSLTTVWAADYRVDGGAWRAVDGTVTTVGGRQRLQVVSASPVLTDPYGRG